MSSRAAGTITTSSRPAAAGPAPARAAWRAWSGRLPSGVAFYLQASIVLFFLAGSSAPTPLYALYQARWGFSPITTTVVFGVYALAVLASLLTVGSLSDHIGRRPVLITAVAAQAAAMLVFATASGVPELLAARVIQGLSTGAAVGAVGAGLLDLNKTKGTIANAVGPITGTATGALGSGLLVQYLPSPTRLVYLALFAIFIIQGLGVALMAETSAAKPGALASLRPQFSLPASVRGPVLRSIPALIAVWALAGLYGSLGPALVGIVSGSHSFVLGGLALFVLAGSAAVTVLLLHSAPPRAVMLAGCVALLAGVAITLLAVRESSIVLFFAGTAVAGAGFGGGFQGAIRTVIPLAAPHERSGVLSYIFVVSYLALGLPAVVAGVLVSHGAGVTAAAQEYGVAVMVLAGLALAGLARQPRRERGQMEPVPAAVPVEVRAMATCGERA
ncbi:MAG: MFS transporter [Actinomycetota bacterium]